MKQGKTYKQGNNKPRGLKAYTPLCVYWMKVTALH